MLVLAVPALMRLPSWVRKRLQENQPPQEGAKEPSVLCVSVCVSVYHLYHLSLSNRISNLYMYIDVDMSSLSLSPLIYIFIISNLSSIYI